jgi:hypothetical protein
MNLDYIFVDEISVEEFESRISISNKIDLGGLGDLRQVTHQSVINGTSYNLIIGLKVTK